MTSRSHSVCSRSVYSLAQTPKYAFKGLPVNRAQFNVIAPPGKLGIVVATCSEGLMMIHGINCGSPLEGLLFKGDLIVTVGDKDTRELNAHDLALLLASHSKFERKIAVLRSLLTV